MRDPHPHFVRLLMHTDVRMPRGAWMRWSGMMHTDVRMPRAYVMHMDVQMPRTHGCAGAVMRWSRAPGRAEGSNIYHQSTLRPLSLKGEGQGEGRTLI
jgi:hypothetical protein